MTKMKANETGALEKKPWQALEIAQLDVPSATQSGTGRIQPGEIFFFYSNS